MAEPVVKVTWDEDFTIMRADVAGSGKPPIIVDTRKMSSVMAHRMVAHGVEQRVRDAAAIPRDTKNGKSASPATKWAAANRIAEHVTSGTDVWSPAREGGAGRIGLDESILSRALKLAFPSRSDDEVRAKVVGATPTQRIEMRSDPRVQPHYDALVKELNKSDEVKSALADW